MTSTEKPGWKSKKFWMAAAGLSAIVLLAKIGGVDGNAFLAVGGIVSVYCGGQAMVDKGIVNWKNLGG